jgi:hypothetical protein
MSRDEWPSRDASAITEALAEIVESASEIRGEFEVLGITLAAALLLPHTPPPVLASDTRREEAAVEAARRLWDLAQRDTT